MLLIVPVDIYNLETSTVTLQQWPISPKVWLFEALIAIGANGISAGTCSCVLPEIVAYDVDMVIMTY